MTADAQTPAQATMELMLLSAEAEAISSSDWYAWPRERGLPEEAAIRLKDLSELTVEIGGRVVSLGKIILIKIIEFVKAHPNLATGIAIGAAIAALVSMIPYLGPVLWPIAAIVGVSLGAVAGHRLDMASNGKPGHGNVNLITLSQDVIDIAKAFFQLLIDIITTVLDGKTLKRI